MVDVLRSWSSSWW